MFHVWVQQVHHDHKAFQRLWRDTEYLGCGGGGGI